MNQACYSDFDNSSEEVITEEPETKMETKVVGFVVGDGNAEGYSLEIDNKSYSLTSDYFEVDAKFILKYNQHIEIKKNGELQGFINAPLLENDVNRMDIKVFPDWESTEMFAGQQTTLDISDAISVHFTGDEFLQDVTLNYGNIADRELLIQTGKYARDLRGNDLVIDPLLGFYIETKDALAMIEGKSYHLAADLSLYSGENLGLFWYNTDKNVWELVKEITESTIALDTEKLGYFKIGDFGSAVFVEGDITISNKRVAYQEILLDGSLLTDYRRKTTAKGKWIGISPAQDHFTGNLVSDCFLNSQSFEISTNEENIEVNYDLEEEEIEAFFPVKLRMVDCDGNFISNPSVRVVSETFKDILSFDEEQVDVLIPMCDHTFNISSFDTQVGSSQGIDVTWDDNIEDDLGVFSKCADWDRGFNYVSIDGGIKIRDKFNIFYYAEGTYIVSEDYSMYFSLPDDQVGLLPNDQIKLRIDNRDSGEGGYFFDCLESDQGCGIDRFYISHIKEGDQDVLRVSFSGTIWALRLDDNKAGNFPLEGQIFINQ